MYILIYTHIYVYTLYIHYIHTHTHTHTHSASVKSLSPVWLFVIPWIVAWQTSLSMGFSRQEYWSRLPFPPPGDLLNLGIEPESLASPVLEGRFFTSASICIYMYIYICMYIYVCIISYFFCFSGEHWQIQQVKQSNGSAYGIHSSYHAPLHPQAAGLIKLWNGLLKTYLQNQDSGNTFQGWGKAL